jgi:hypothetical protein
LACSGFPESLVSSASFIYGRLANHWMGSYPKIHPPGLDSDFQAYKKVALTTLLVCRNTCPIWAFCGFPKSPGLSASFTYGRLANQGIGTHPKIHPPGLDSDFQADEKQYD